MTVSAEAPVTDPTRPATKLAIANLTRTEKLKEQNATTAQQLDVQAAERNTAKADVATAKASLRQAELNLSYTEIRAPISGRIGRLSPRQPRSSPLSRRRKVTKIPRCWSKHGELVRYSETTPLYRNSWRAFRAT